MAVEKKRPGVGIGVMLLNEKGEVLLGRRVDGNKHGSGTWCMPGGGLDYGEELEDAAQREVQEETSIVIDKEKTRLISVANDMFDEGVHFVTLGYLAEKFTGEPQVREPHKIREWQWCSLNNLPEPLFLGTKRIIEKYRTCEI